MDVFANVIYCLAKKKTWPHVQCYIVVFDNKRVDLTSSEVSDTDVEVGSHSHVQVQSESAIKVKINQFIDTEGSH